MFSTLIRVILTLCLVILSGAPLQPVLAKDSPALAAERIKAAIMHAGVVDTEYRQQIYSSFENGVVSVTLFRHPDATKADCKIDAVLIARRIIALAPNEVKMVRCVFYDYDKPNYYWELEVRARLVAAFAQGKINEIDLINSVLLSADRQNNPLSSKYAALSYSGILNENAVCKGACEDRRLAIDLRLREMEKQGVELGHFRDDFLRMEDAARRGKAADLPAQITAFNKSLDGYEEEMIRAGQMQKPERRRSRNSIGAQEGQKQGPGLGL